MARSDAPANSTFTLRSTNFRQVLYEIWNSDSPNRAGIARNTGLSRTTTSDMVNELIDLGVVEESGSGASRGGRRPILLRPVPNSRAVVGIEAGASHVDVVVMNLMGQVLASSSMPHRVPDDVNSTLDIIESLVADCVEKSGIAPHSIPGAGLAVSSPLDGDDLRHVSAMTMPAWDGIDVVQVLEDRLGLPVKMDNDANLGAVAEQWWGVGKGCNDATYIKLGVGIGAGHIIGGTLYRGSGGTAGEIGHVNLGGEDLCRCGRVGCLEMHVGSDAIVSLYSASENGHGPMTIDGVVDAARSGDKLALGLIVAAGTKLGAAIAPILNILNPTLIILSGPLIRAGAEFLDAVTEAALSQTLPKTADEATIVVSEFEHLTVAIGAATAALEVVFDGGAAAWGRRPAATAGVR